MRFNFYARELPFVHCHFFFCTRKFYAGRHVKITRHWKYNPKGEKGKGGRVGVGGPIMLWSKTVGGGGGGGAPVNPPLPVQLVLSIIIHLDTWNDPSS